MVGERKNGLVIEEPRDCFKVHQFSVKIRAILNVLNWVAWIFTSTTKKGIQKYRKNLCGNQKF